MKIQRIENPISDDLFLEWHDAKNGELTPYMVSAHSDRKVWWKGKCGHEWQAVVGNRSKGGGCPYCSSRRVLKGFNDLATLRPDLAAEWNHEKNGGLTPDAVAIHSNKKVWWKGKCGHEWEAVVDKRQRGYGCPYCAGRLLKGFNDLATLHPDIAAEWDYEKNEDMTPDSVTEKSRTVVWWKCSNGHEWKSSVMNRAVMNKSCPYCNEGKRKKASLSEKFPQIAAEWNYERNGDLTPDNVGTGSKMKVWWLCEKGHEWEAEICRRTYGRSCPYCLGRRVLKGFNDLATTDPAVAAEWNYKKNGTLTPEMVTAGSQKHVWWRCQKGHEWNAAIYSRHHGHGCPYCAGKKSEILSVANPDIAAEWHPTKNGNLTPADVAPSSKKKVWWLGKCGHEWQAVVCQRTNGNGCPYCHNRRILKGFNDLATRNPAIAAEWHPTKNGSLTPADVAPSSRKKVWWIGRCGHEWETTVASRSQGNGCPYCSGQKVMAGFNDLATADPSLAAEWHPTKNGTLSPADITPVSGKKVWWLGKCGHEWESTVANRANGCGCPYCHNRRILKGFNDLATFNPALAAEWSPTKNGGLSPYDVTDKSGKKVWWLGKCGHEWQAVVRNRNKGSGCPYCANKTTKSK